MNENAKAWVEALRSGKYKQTRRRLHDNDGYCCLGVGCEIAVEAGVIQPPKERRRGEWVLYLYDDNHVTLPKAVQDWLGLSTQTGDFKLRNGMPECLSGMNDDGADFEWIADVIESQPPGLFKEEE